MFAATAGVMTSVALSLFSEGLGLTHNRNMGIGFAVFGMGMMGVSFALTA
jgi:ZIP family zinc transporter